MSKFAKIGEEAVRRNAELVGEELRLYVLIVFHTWSDSGVCKKTLRELSDIYGLDYDNTTRRYKSLRTKQWCENTKLGIRPLVGLKTVKFTVNGKEQTVNFTVENDTEAVNSTALDCQNYSKTDDKTVNSTVTFKGSTEPLKNPDFSSEPSETKIVSDTTTAHEKNGHKSQFSKEDIIRYLDIRIRNGEQIETPHKLAQWMYQTGDYDAFINATLYPESVEQTIEYDDGETPNGSVPQPLDEYELLDARDLLKSMAEHGVNLSELKNKYTAEDWQWLMAQVN